MSEFKGMKVPTWLIYLAVIAVVITTLPLAIIAKARFATSTKPRIHIVPDMDNQMRPETQQASVLFRDGRSSRLPVEGTVAREALVVPTVHSTGMNDIGEFVERMPVTLDAELLARGRERYEIYCSICHGVAGYGDGAVNQRAVALAQGTWTPAASFHTDVVRQRSDGELFNTITHGIRNMPAYGSQIGADDRWAIVAWTRVLQRSQNATIDDVPASNRAELN